MHDFARTLPAGGSRTVEVGATARHPARTATVAVSWAKVTLLVPVQPRGEIRGVPLTTWGVRVAEVDAPPNVEPLEWILLTNSPVNDAADANERIDWYQIRWLVEVFHADYDEKDNLYRGGRWSYSSRAGVVEAGPLVPAAQTLRSRRRPDRKSVV